MGAVVMLPATPARPDAAPYRSSRPGRAVRSGVRKAVLATHRL